MPSITHKDHVYRTPTSVDEQIFQQHLIKRYEYSDRYGEHLSLVTKCLQEVFTLRLPADCNVKSSNQLICVCPLFDYIPSSSGQLLHYYTHCLFRICSEKRMQSMGTEKMIWVTGRTWAMSRTTNWLWGTIHIELSVAAIRGLLRVCCGQIPRSTHQTRRLSRTNGEMDYACTILSKLFWDQS